MPEKTEYAPGTPTWVDLATTDADAAGTFYSTLFGWRAEPVPGPDAGGYTMFTLNGRLVAAMAPMAGPDHPPAWTTYISTDDADKTVEIAEAAGAKVLQPPMDVMGAGRMAIFADPTGAVIALWQPGEHRGAQLVDEPGTFTWTELSTRDTAAAETFYTTTFGWTAESSDAGGMAYTEYKVGDLSVAGMMAPGPDQPAGTPAYWMPYFAVADPDKAAGEASALGGTTLAGPMDFPGGRLAILRDPQGAVFGVLRLTPKP
jgi:predicted enzyme related to lactoylglutathione lyase